ncbi:MAG: DUF6788 family protein [Solirubrobacterales bacterium]
MPEHTPQPSEHKAQRRLSAALAEIGFVLPGSVVVRRTRCGKASCRCKADPPTLHGPYLQWTRKVAGKTVTRNLSPDQLERYQPWFDNARRLRELNAELEALSLRAAERAEGWPSKP